MRFNLVKCFAKLMEGFNRNLDGDSNLKTKQHRQKSNLQPQEKRALYFIKCGKRWLCIPFTRLMRTKK